MKNPCFFGWFALLFTKKKARKGRSGSSAFITENPPIPIPICNLIEKKRGKCFQHRGNPKGPHRTQNTTATQSIVNYCDAVFPTKENACKIHEVGVCSGEVAMVNHSSVANVFSTAGTFGVMSEITFDLGFAITYVHYVGQFC